MVSQEEYFRYLVKRSFLGGIYRRNFLYPILSKYLRGRTIDIGCGIGDMLAFRPNTVGVDINSFNVTHCQARGGNAFLMEPDFIPFEHATFDSALLDNVLEHIIDPKPLLGEVFRVLRSNGRFVVGVPGVRGFSSDPDHKRFYDEEALISSLKEANFSFVDMIHMPFKSRLLDQRMRQYCLYGVFQRD